MLTGMGASANNDVQIIGMFLSSRAICKPLSDCCKCDNLKKS